MRDDFTALPCVQQYHGEVIVLVQAPAVTQIPWRKRIVGTRRTRRRFAVPAQGLAQYCHGQDGIGYRRQLRQQRRAMALDQSGIERPRVVLRVGERRMRAQRAQERNIGHHAGDLIFAKRGTQASQRGSPIAVPDNQLGDHRIIVHADFIAGLHTAVDAHLRIGLRFPQMFQKPAGGQKPARRILGIDARLDGMAVDSDLPLVERQRFAAGHAQLPFDQIEAGDHLGHRMLNLQARVHFHEIEISVRLGDELHRARADVAHRLCRLDRRITHLLAARLVHARRRGFLDNFLVAALHRTVALEQMHAMALRIGEYLNLDMARAREIFLDQHPVIAERRSGLALRRGQCRGEFLRRIHHAHALAAAAGAGLDQHRIADARGFLRQHGGILRIAVITRDQRHASLGHQRFRR